MSLRPVEELFAELLGREPSEKESLELRRIGQVLELRADDALWLVLVALRYHESLYLEHPERMKDAVREGLLDLERRISRAGERLEESARNAVTSAIRREKSAYVDAEQRNVSTRGHPFSGDRTFEAVGALVALLTLFGAACFTLGTIWGAGRIPVWASTPSLSAAILTAPAGWISYLLLLPFFGIVFIRNAGTLADPNRSKQTRLQALLACLVCGGMTITEIILILSF